MATPDVPGANPAHNDALHAGCWGEHEDGSHLFVEALDNGRVIYLVFDLSKTPTVEYRDAMQESGFKKQFSWDPKDPKSIKWTWHDKTPFPWNKIIKAGVQDGARVSAVEQLIQTAAAVIASRQRLQGRGRPVSKSEVDDLILRIKSGGVAGKKKSAAAALVKKLQGAIRGLGA